MCVSSYTPIGSGVKLRREPFDEAADIGFDQHRDPNGAGFGGREGGAFAPPVRQADRRLDVDVRSTQPARDIGARYETRQAQVDTELVRQPAEARAFGPVAENHHLERIGSARGTRGLDAPARAHQPIVALDRHEPANGEHGRARKPDCVSPEASTPARRGHSPAYGMNGSTAPTGPGTPASAANRACSPALTKRSVDHRREQDGGRSRAPTGCVRAARRRPNARRRGGGPSGRRRAPRARSAPASAIRWRSKW